MSDPIHNLIGGPIALGPLTMGSSTAHLDRACEHEPSWALLDGLDDHDAITRKGICAPFRAGRRWILERT